MRLSDYDYDLPKELIAQRPLNRRESSRLMVVDRETGEIQHRSFSDLPDYLEPGDLMILNDTRVFKAALEGRRKSGGKVDILLIRKTGDGSWEAMVKPSRRLRVGEMVELGGGCRVEVGKKVQSGRRIVGFIGCGDTEAILRFGRVPLPPYIRRQPDESDEDRYQTVYASSDGAVAAPTAGLHFTDELIERIRAKGVDVQKISLHVGPGTFKPITSEDIEAHIMEEEYFEVSEDVQRRLVHTREEGKRIFVVGTTCVRALESLSVERMDQSQSGWTGLFITPPYRFKYVDCLATNFHLPKTTLLLLVSALMGRDRLLASYREAIDRRYRFYSYGDAMLVHARSPS
jgi:S-adenosylmethionine:tRNA ribosyltransferase-isomerase